MTWNVGYNCTVFSAEISEMSILCYQFSQAFTANPLFKLSLSFMCPSKPTPQWDNCWELKTSDESQD